MVVAPPLSQSPEINSEAKSKQRATPQTTYRTMTNGRSGSPKLKHSNSVSHARKTTSLSPARPIPRSKSMNGLNRVDSNKIKANGIPATTTTSMDGRVKKVISPQQYSHKNDHPNKLSRGGTE